MGRLLWPDAGWLHFVAMSGGGRGTGGDQQQGLLAFALVGSGLTARQRQTLDQHDAVRHARQHVMLGQHRIEAGRNKSGRGWRKPAQRASGRQW